MLKKLFTDHPATVGETYSEHFVQASSFSGRLFVASIACFIHGLIPGLCVKTGSNTIQELHECMVTNRHLQTAQRKDKLRAS